MSIQSNLLEGQDVMENSGWRIQQISHARGGKPIMVGLENWAGYVGLVGLLFIPVGIGLAIYTGKYWNNPVPGIAVGVLGWVVLLISIPLKIMVKKRNRTYVKGKCIDREIRKVKCRRGDRWTARILCEISINGETIRCTPNICWYKNSFSSEKAAMDLLNLKIGSDGSCMLRINPSKLELEAELADSVKSYENEQKLDNGSYMKK